MTPDILPRRWYCVELDLLDLPQVRYIPKSHISLPLSFVCYSRLSLRFKSKYTFRGLVLGKILGSE